MPESDELYLEILPDGSLRLTTDLVSQANHLSAEHLVAFLARLLGGEQTVERRDPTTDTWASQPSTHQHS